MNKIVITYSIDDILNLIKKDVTETFNDRPNYKLFIDEVKFDRYFSDGGKPLWEAHADISFEEIVGETKNCRDCVQWGTCPCGKLGHE